MTKEVVSIEEMCNKIKADARAVYGSEEAVRRVEVYWEAGANLIILEAPKSLEELEYYAKTLVPKGIMLSANMLDGGRTPLVTFKQLEEMDFSSCSVPVMIIYAAAKGVMDAVSRLMADGKNANLGDGLITFSEFNKLIGLHEIRDLEEKQLGR